MTASNSSSLVLAIIRSRTMPALFTRTSTPPYVLRRRPDQVTAWSQSEMSDPSAIFATGRKDLVDHCPYERCRLPANRPVPPISLTTTRTPAAKRQCMCAADAATRSGDDDHLAVDRS